MLIVLAWSGSVILQLGSPVVPFIDVLPNHVAPAQHLATFGAFDVLTTAPSPIYGPSRMFLGYTGLLGSAAVLSGQTAALAVAAFILPATVLVGAGMARLASAIHGVGVGWWMLLAFALTESFARMADARATVIALALTAFCLVELLERDERARPLSLAVALGVTFLFHPLVGLLTAAVVVAMVAIYPDRYARIGVPALVGGGILALPQAATMVAVDLPSALGLVVIPPAIGGVWLFDRSGSRAPLVCPRPPGPRRRCAGGGARRRPAQGRAADQLLRRLLPPVPGPRPDRGRGRGRRRPTNMDPVAVAGLLIGLLAVIAAAVIPWGPLGIEGVDSGHQDSALLDAGVPGRDGRLCTLGDLASARASAVGQAAGGQRLPGRSLTSAAGGADPHLPPR